MFPKQMQVVLENDAPGFGSKGQKVNLQLLPSDVHDPTELPSYLAGFKAPAMRADEASPVVLVDNDEDKFRTFSSDDAFEPVNVKGSLTGAVPEVDPRSSLDSYKVVNRFVGSFVPRITEMQASYDARMAASKRCMRALMLDREIDVWTLLGTNTNWAAAQRLALGGTENWNGGSTSDPIKNLQTVMENALQDVTEFWMNRKVANAFLRHDKVRDHMRQILGDGPAANTIVSVLAGTSTDFVLPGLPPIRVAPSKYKNSSGNVVYTLGDVVVGIVKTPGTPTDGEEIASSYTFRRKGPSGVGIDAYEFFMQGGRGPHGGTMVVVAMADIAKMVGNTCGGIITSVIV